MSSTSGRRKVASPRTGRSKAAPVRLEMEFKDGTSRTKWFRSNKDARRHAVNQPNLFHAEVQNTDNDGTFVGRTEIYHPGKRDWTFVGKGL